MRSIAQADGHDAPRLVDELGPWVTAVIEVIVVGFEHAVRYSSIPSFFAVDHLQP
jgi:hypothetical protein